MSIHHHLSDETLARFASGTLGAGLSLVAETHIADCVECRARLLELGGAAATLALDLPPAKLAADALAHTFALIERPTPRPLVRPPRPEAQSLDTSLARPPTLHNHALGSWRPIAPGVRMSWVQTPEDPNASVILLWAKAGKRLPQHTHKGIELTQVLKGAYADDFGHFGVGDILEAGGDVEHRPVVDTAGDCICLAAIEGKILFSGWLGRILRPFTGG